MHHNKVYTRFAVALAAIPLAGCGFFSATDTHEPNDLPDYTARVEARVEWSANVGEGASQSLTPAVTENAVYAAGGNRIYRFERDTGNVVWSAETGGMVTAGVGTDGNYVAVGTDRGEVEVYDAEGRFVWRATLASDIEIPPLVGAGRVVVKSSDTRISGFDLITGQRVWRYQGQTPALTLKAFSQMTWSPAGILVGQANGRLLALNPSDGKVIFEAPIGISRGITEVERLIDVVGRPWVDRELMCAATFQGNLVCMQTQNGRTVWNVKVDAVTGPVADGRAVYEVDAQGKIHAYNRANGREAWVNDDFLYRGVSAPIRVGSTLAFGDYEGYVSMLNPADGEVVGRVKLSGAIAAPAAQFGYGAVFQTTEGEVALITERSLDSE